MNRLCVICAHPNPCKYGHEQVTCMDRKAEFAPSTVKCCLVGCERQARWKYSEPGRPLASFVLCDDHKDTDERGKHCFEFVPWRQMKRQHAFRLAWQRWYANRGQTQT